MSTLPRIAWAATLLLMLVAASSGCRHHNLACNSCSGGAVGGCSNGGCGSGACLNGQCGGGQMLAGGGCRDGRCNGVPGGMYHNGRPARVGQVQPGANDAPVGPQMAQYAYPWYTMRGPRDFLLDNPPSIGR